MTTAVGHLAGGGHGGEAGLASQDIESLGIALAHAFPLNQVAVGGGSLGPFIGVVIAIPAGNGIVGSPIVRSLAAVLVNCVGFLVIQKAYAIFFIF